MQNRQVKLENSPIIIYNVHDSFACRGRYCTIHNRSNHPMRHLPQLWRNDKGIMERVCEHGIGHPDPDEYMLAVDDSFSLHGCDGCCQGIDRSNDPQYNLL